MLLLFILQISTYANLDGGSTVLILTTFAWESLKFSAPAAGFPSAPAVVREIANFWRLQQCFGQTVFAESGLWRALLWFFAKLFGACGVLSFVFLAKLFGACGGLSFGFL